MVICGSAEMGGKIEWEYSGCLEKEDFEDAKDKVMIGKENLKSVQEGRRHEKVSELTHLAWLWAF